jgi:hypothetical protein
MGQVTVALTAVALGEATVAVVTDSFRHAQASRDVPALFRAPRARVLKRTRATAELDR